MSRPISTPIIFWNEKDIWNYIKLYNLEYSDIYNKGYDRTGCVFCMFGVHKEDPTRLEKLKISHNNLYNYCLEKLDLKTVLEWYPARTNK
jgi:3'-phosphoadenosine 5'-phosphosulfate sulfotransferase (PAPS reductase)/FAD synthetase